MKKIYYYCFSAIITIRDITYNSEDYDNDDESLKYLKLKYYSDYLQLQNDYINAIVALISDCGCKYVTLDWLDAHKWEIREIVKGNRALADKLISDVFKFKEEQRLSMESASELLGYAFDRLCDVILTNKTHSFELITGAAFMTYVRIPFKLSNYKREYVHGDARIVCKLNEIED